MIFSFRYLVPEDTIDFPSSDEESEDLSGNLGATNTIEKLSLSSIGNPFSGLEQSQWVISELIFIEPRAHSLMFAASPTSFIIIGGIDAYRNYIRFGGGSLVCENLEQISEVTW